MKKLKKFRDREEEKAFKKKKKHSLRNKHFMDDDEKWDAKTYLKKHFEEE